MTAAETDWTGRHWTGTAYIDLRDPAPEDIRLADICLNLSRIPRFNGGTVPGPAGEFSVAHHILHCDALAAAQGQPEIVRREILLHDLAEYAICDMPAPLKRLPELAGYRAIEARLGDAIRGALDPYYIVRPRGLWPEAACKRIDALALALEKRALISWTAGPWPGCAEAAPGGAAPNADARLRPLMRLSRIDVARALSDRLCTTFRARAAPAMQSQIAGAVSCAG